MRPLPAVVSLLTVSTLAHAAGDLDKLHVGDRLNGFQATVLYLDEKDHPLGARFVHEKTKHTLDLLQVETVPQAYTWITSIPVSDQGEPHTQEHLLLLKGTRGRTLSTRQTMSLSTSSAFTQKWRTSYFFNTAAGEDVFFDLYAEQTRAMLHPNYTDEEIRREVRFFGTTQNADGTLRLEEQGTVYQEMVSSSANPFSRLFRASEQMVYGERHPLAFNSGGEPSGIRTMSAQDIRRFQKATHHLANMGTIAAFAPSTPVASVLARFDKVLASADPEAKPRPSDSLEKLPAPAPAPAGMIRIVEYPQRSDQQPSPLMLAWPNGRKLEANEEFLADLFVANIAGDATTNLYKLFIDGRTRKLDIGARSVGGFVQSYGSQPMYILFRDAAPANFNEAKLAEVRKLVVDEIRRIAAFADGSPELAEFNERLRSRLVERHRDLVKFTGTPPGFGFRGGSSQWMDHLTFLEKASGTSKSLTLKPQIAFVEGLLDSKRNFWREYVAKWRLDTEPYVSAARPSPALVQREEAERAARSAAETERLKAFYKVDDAQAALKRFAADAEKEAAAIEAEARKVPPIAFVKSPPMTLDDALQYEVVKTANGVPLVASRFDTMTSATLGLALRLDGVPREDLRYVSLLPALLTQVGVIENGKPVSFEEMSERLRKEILGLDARISDNVRTGRIELVVHGSGIGADEATRAIDWMNLVLQSPDWRAENLPRIRDLVDQSLSRLRNTMQGAEEGWVNNPVNAYRMQRNPAYVAAESFLTRGHNVLRLRWLLKEVSREDGTAISAFTGNLIDATRGKPRAELRALLTPEKAPGFAELPASAKPVVQDFLKDVDLALVDVPDASLQQDFAYLAKALRDDLLTPPAEALARLEAVRKRVLRAGGARLFLASSADLRATLAPKIDALAARLDAAPFAAVSYGSTPLVDERLQARDASVTKPVHVGLFSPNKQGGVVITSVPGVHFADAGDRDKALDFLASRLYAGGGSHGIFLKTLAAGLAYSNGLRGSVASGRVGYYAERTPELPQTVRFVVKTLKEGKPVPQIGEYAVAQAFLEQRAAQTFEARAEGIAADLADGQPPEQVRRFREAILQLRKEPRLADELFARKDAVYARMLPGYGVKAADVAGGTYYVIGPDKQLDLWEQYLQSVEGPGTKLNRLYGRDYWMP